MSRIPIDYRHAYLLGPDGRAALAAARLVWDRLTTAMRECLREGRTVMGGRICYGRLGTMRALVRRGLLSPARWRLAGESGSVGLDITCLGELVREVGIRSQVEADHA